VSALHIAWMLARYLGSALIVAGVVTHRWRGWLHHPWWWVVAAATSLAWSGQEAWRGHIVWGLLYFAGSMVVAYQLVTANERERVSHRG